MGTPTIEGTYRLVRRDLPEGSDPPGSVLKGMITFTRGFRNFSVVWNDEDGRYYSECYVARYALDDNEYTETPEYLIVDDQIHGKKIRYDMSNAPAASPVTRDGDRLSFALPQPFERDLDILVEFKGDRMTASATDRFTDHWERVS